MTTAIQTKAAQPTIHPALMGMWVFLATISMLFAAFTSAYLIRRVAADWVPITLPTILWFNTAVLLISSACVEMSRTAVGRGRWRTAGRWLGLTILLGWGFLIGQLAAWRDLVAQGVFVPTSPHSSFFYILTGLHGLHLLGGLGLLIWVTFRLTGQRSPEDVEARRWSALAATFWHFLGGLWIFVFLVLRAY